MLDFSLPMLPPQIDLETKRVLKRVNDANRELASLNGFSKTIPNQYVLINSLGLQEAKDSSAIESIITTNDELYKAGLFDLYLNRYIISHNAAQCQWATNNAGQNIGCERFSDKCTYSSPAPEAWRGPDR